MSFNFSYPIIFIIFVFKSFSIILFLFFVHLVLWAWWVWVCCDLGQARNIDKLCCTWSMLNKSIIRLASFWILHLKDLEYFRLIGWNFSDASFCINVFLILHLYILLGICSYLNSTDFLTFILFIHDHMRLLFVQIHLVNRKESKQHLKHQIMQDSYS